MVHPKTFSASTTAATTAVASVRSSFDASLAPKSQPDSIEAAAATAKEMEQRLHEQMQLNLARQPSAGATSHDVRPISPIDTPTTLAGSLRHSLDGHGGKGGDIDEKKRGGVDLEKVVAALESGVVIRPGSKDSTDDDDDDEDVGPAPDGGFKAWLVVAGTFLMIMTNFGLLTSYGVFGTYYASHQLAHLPASTVSWIGSVQTFCVYAGSVVFGKLCDDFGPRWFLMVGSILTFASLLAVSWCEQFWQFVLVQGFLFGIGGSMLFLPSCTIVGQYFDRRRGLAMGIIIGAASFGGIVWPLVLSALFASPSLGFAWGTRISALLLGVMLALANAVMKPRLKPNRSSAKTTSVPWTSTYRVFANVDYAIFVAGIFFAWINFFVPYFQISSYAKLVGFDTDMASRCITIMNTASLVGRIASGPLADRYGRFNCLSIFGVLSSVSLLVLWPVPGLMDTRAGVMLLSVFYGLFSGGSIAIASACCAQLSTPRELGTRLGMLWTSAAPGLLIGPVVSTKLIDAMHSSYLGLAMWAGFMTLFGFALIVLARFRLAKWRWAAIV
ncbi:uncharacterized protein PFL1_06134 [Pseudozyma flocculosa PF-1]|uniref:Related to Monocarboxylate transporter 1 n=2 Tax=Pseudozyma flocculosa TaxID=84751 RepID=A0A5C3F9T1_9BASI|nr:uncharacterized protein PFL1_06134 [Pseudozyma flocculosa PF-1]EPQ26198.1 hypothetical protein PFL1_06134 [Pseudozyma flocculosa PF-1]SPO40151.1 related to Monocarboxylate transporter 1 [Pseudozyma flocculosa]